MSKFCNNVKITNLEFDIKGKKVYITVEEGKKLQGITTAIDKLMDRLGNDTGNWQFCCDHKRSEQTISLTW